MAMVKNTNILILWTAINLSSRLQLLSVHLPAGNSSPSKLHPPKDSMSCNNNNNKIGPTLTWQVWKSSPLCTLLKNSLSSKSLHTLNDSLTWTDWQVRCNRIYTSVKQNPFHTGVFSDSFQTWRIIVDKPTGHNFKSISDEQNNLTELMFKPKTSGLRYQHSY